VIKEKLHSARFPQKTLALPAHGFELKPGVSHKGTNRKKSQR
jgi:hypothetical protein